MSCAAGHAILAALTGYRALKYYVHCLLRLTLTYPTKRIRLTKEISFYDYTCYLRFEACRRSSRVRSVQPPPQGKRRPIKCESRPHASLVHFSLGKKMAAVPVVSTGHLHFNDVFLSTYGHLLSYASLTTLLINSTMEGTPSGIKSRYRRQVNKGDLEIALLHVKTPYHKAISTRNDIIQHCTAIIYYSEKHCRRALTNSKNVKAVFINKFAVKGSAYSVLVHILWKCLFKLMQYSMVYSVSCRSISRRLLFMHFTGMTV